MIIENLDWDSDFFNYKIGKLILEENQLFDIGEFLKKAEKHQLIYVFSKQIINNDLLELVDNKVVFKKNIIEYSEEIVTDAFEIKSFDYTIHDYNELEKLAIESGAFSRFKIDANFKNGEFEKLYSRWIELSAKKELAFDVLVATNKENSILGFVTLNKKNENLVDIGLVAVSEMARGKGIAKKLLNYSFNKSIELGYNEIQVVTQFNNLPAMNLYESVGFKITEKTFIYHYWNL